MSDIDALAEMLDGDDGRLYDVFGLWVQGKRDTAWVAQALAATPPVAALLADAAVGRAVKRLDDASHEWHIDCGGGEYGVRVSLVDEQGVVHHAYGFGPDLPSAIKAALEGET